MIGSSITFGQRDKVGVDSEANIDFLGALGSTGNLRTTTGISYVDGGDFITLGVDLLGIESLVDPNADRLLFWDDGETASKWLTPAEGIQIDTTNLKLDVNGLDAITTIDAAADYVLVYDATDSTHKKILPTNLGHRFVDRGDPSSVDFSVGDFTTDSTWRDLDLSSIVPVGAVAVLLHVIVKDDVTNSQMLFRRNGNSNVWNRSVVATQAANISIFADIIVSCDSNRVIEYNGITAVAFTTISVIVKGWYI